MNMLIYKKLEREWFGKAIEKISGLTKDSLLILFVSFSFAVVSYVVGEKFSVKIDKDTLYYTYSSITQGFIGLVALLGMLAIFRLNALNKQCNQEKYYKKQNNIRKELLRFIFIPIIAISFSLLFLISVDIIESESLKLLKLPFLVFVSSLSLFSIGTTPLYIWRLIK